jgi:hypothetical protein
MNSMTFGKFFRNISVLALVAALISCSSDQDIDNPNAASQDSASARSLAVGVQSDIRVDMDIFLQTVSTFGREVYFLDGDPRFTDDLLKGPIDPGSFLITRSWAARYAAIRNCHIILERAATEPVSTIAEGYRGFAKTFIAHQLSLNLALTHNNGIRTDVADVSNLGPIVGRDVSHAAIDAFYQEAIGHLANAGSSFDFSLSSGFAGFDTPASFATFVYALKARNNLHANNFAAALSDINNSFISTELGMNYGVFHVFGTGTGDNPNFIFEDPTAAFVKYVAHPSFGTDAEAGDQRYANKVLERETTFSLNGLSSNLAVVLSKSNTDPFGLIRNEELLLLRAEARAQTGDLQGATDDVNVVRLASGLEPVATFASTDEAVNRVLFERRYSLFSEGHRWVDMRRYGRLGELPLDRAGDIVIEQMPIPDNENNL